MLNVRPDDSPECVDSTRHSVENRLSARDKGPGEPLSQSMNSGYAFMIAGLLCFSTLGVFHKIADVKRCRPTAVNALIYSWSLLFAIAATAVVQGRSPAAPLPVAVIAIPFGVSASIAILAFQAGIRHGDIATSWLAINLSSGIPTLASILIYGESLTGRKIFALLLIPVSMALLWVDKRRGEQKQRAEGERDLAAARAREDRI